MNGNNGAADQAHSRSLERELEEQLISGAGPTPSYGVSANGNHQPSGLGMQPRAADLASKLTGSNAQSSPMKPNFLQQMAMQNAQNSLGAGVPQNTAYQSVRQHQQLGLNDRLAGQPEPMKSTMPPKIQESPVNVNRLTTVQTEASGNKQLPRRAPSVAESALDANVGEQQVTVDEYASQEVPASSAAEQKEASGGAPLQTFESGGNFEQMMKASDGSNKGLPERAALTQALLLTNNAGQAAGQVAADYLNKNDYIADLLKVLQQKGETDRVNKLLLNLGTQDKASNWMLEQRNLQRAFSKEDRGIRDLVASKIVDNAEYDRVKEEISLARERSKQYLADGSDEEAQLAGVVADNANDMLAASKHSSDTQEDSGGPEAKTLPHDEKIRHVIKQIRGYGKRYLDGIKEQTGAGQANEAIQSTDATTLLPLSVICKKLRNNKAFLEDCVRKRELKSQTKATGESAQDLNLRREKLRERIKSLETVLGLDQQLKSLPEASVEKAVVEPAYKRREALLAKAREIEKILLNYCGLETSVKAPKLDEKDTPPVNGDTIYGPKHRKLPTDSTWLTNAGENLFALETNEETALTELGLTKDIKLPDGELADSATDAAIDRLLKRSQMLEQGRTVKIIGLQPEKLFEKVDKYKVKPSKLPPFSSHFDTLETCGLGAATKHTVPGQQILNTLKGSNSFQRIDGRQVISLSFNPYFLEDTDQKKAYEDSVRDILDQRERLSKILPKDAKAKLESTSLRKAWMSIAKRDIPKAYRIYQKFKSDQENACKKLSTNCQREIRKRAVKTQRLAKEAVVRARRLTKEMGTYWRKRDRELADTRRKREKIDREARRRQQEEEEAMLQKKRLEYLMQQSEIYAHFMAKKVGVADDQNKVFGSDDEEPTKKDKKKFKIDKEAARKNVRNIINENRKRLQEFDDQERDQIREEDLQVIDESGEDSVEEQEQTGGIYDQKQLTLTVTQPSYFKGELKTYQLKGLQWLDNLFEQGINGILADEMGLGKTIQAISLMAHLAERKNVWGPFLIVVPVSTLHNWQNELATFCPDLKVLPYFGSLEERKRLSKFLDPKNLYNPAMRIHVLLTSYNMVVGQSREQQRLMKIKWTYMILDEAQAIKNINSRRWRTLLGFQTRNRLLLSGTPIQNSMAELWALLHFIMPKLFDNHEQFQEWFSKDIEQHSMDQGELNRHQLKRLHMILQPFMLRRLKKDVEQEIAPKVEEIIECTLSHRQRVLYDRIKMKISAQDLFMLASSKAKVENLMNLVMQFRKVCNHPDLFESRMGKTPLMFSKLNVGMSQNLWLPAKPEVFTGNQPSIEYTVPKIIYDECYLPTDNMTRTFTQFRRGHDPAWASVSAKTHFDLFNIFTEKDIYDKPGILALLMKSNRWSAGTLSRMALAQASNNDQQAGGFVMGVALLHFYASKFKRQFHRYVLGNKSDTVQVKHGFQSNRASESVYGGDFDIVVTQFVTRNDLSVLYQSETVYNNNECDRREPLIAEKPWDMLHFTRQLKKMTTIFYEKVISAPVGMNCSSTSFWRLQQSFLANPMGKKVLHGSEFKPASNYYIGREGRERSAFFTEDSGRLSVYDQSVKYENGPPVGYDLLKEGLLTGHDDNQYRGSCSFQLPDHSRMVTDCAKMTVLAEMLQRLHRGGHRCLIFCQMTRMMDILEDFLIWQKFSYFRMDGSTQLMDRRFMTEEFQTNPNIFCFILSTRAGGLGINLIAADTVIFYDNDWNPTMDSQATDRAHRIGQKKKVHVYRLVTKGTVEERILKRARQKESVQSTVYGANMKTDQFTTRDVVDMIIDDCEDPLAQLNKNEVRGFIKTGKTEKKKRKKKSGKETIVYTRPDRIAAHEKFEAEGDLLLKNMHIEPVEIEEDAEDEVIEEIPAVEDVYDKEKLLRSIKDQTGKVQFRFEEEDAAQSAAKLKEKPKKRGRPKKGENGDAAMGEEEDENDDYGSEGELDQ